MLGRRLRVVVAGHQSLRGWHLGGYALRACRNGVVCALAVLWSGFDASLNAQTTESGWRYTLIEGATFSDECPMCGRPTIVLPLSGSFDLRRVAENPLITTYKLENIDWEAGFEGGPHYRVTGSGEYQVGGEVIVTQKLALTVWLETAEGGRRVEMNGNQSPLERLWPMISASSTQTNGTPTQQLEVLVAAAPFQELWISTVHGMTAASTPPPFTHFPASDLLSADGRRIRSNAQLTRNLGLMPPAPDIGLDAVHVNQGGELLFSGTAAAFSESLGHVGPGDVISESGEIVRRYLDLIAPFSPLTPVSDQGIDAFHAVNRSEYVFSLTASLFSEKLGRLLGPGDLLSSSGTVFRSAAQLFSRFHPVAGEGEPSLEELGVDAVFLWPGGEIWFSTQRSFQDKERGPVGSGDLLSDAGYVVRRNLDLVARFSPMEDLSDFGLDALEIVTDAIPPELPVQIADLYVMPPPSGDVRLQWSGGGRFFQVLGATSPADPFTPISAVQVGNSIELDGWMNHHRDFYFKLRRW